MMAAAAATYADLPGGHSEGYDDTFKQLVLRFYQSVLDPSMPADYLGRLSSAPTFGSWELGVGGCEL
jgi:hypothetical protein